MSRRFAVPSARLTMRAAVTIALIALPSWLAVGCGAALPPSPTASTPTAPVGKPSTDAAGQARRPLLGAKTPTAPAGDASPAPPAAPVIQPESAAPETKKDDIKPSAAVEAKGPPPAPAAPPQPPPTVLQH